MAQGSRFRLTAPKFCAEFKSFVTLELAPRIGGCGDGALREIAPPQTPDSGGPKGFLMADSKSTYKNEYVPCFPDPRGHCRGF